MTGATGAGPGPGAATPDPGRPWSRASLILGIVALPVGAIPVVGFVSYLLGVVGIGAGFVGRAGSVQPGNATLGTIGIVLCIAAVLVATFWQVLFVLLG